MQIRNVTDFETLMQYIQEKLEWNFDVEDIDEIDDFTYEFSAGDIGLEAEAFVDVSSFYQLRPMTDNQPFGIFAITFESKKLEVSALKKTLSKLVTKKRNNPEYPTWDKQDLIFLCFWGDNSEHYIGFASFDDSDKNLPQLKIEHINPAIEDAHVLSEFENRIKGLSMPADTTDTNAWRMQWQSVFTRTYHQTITDSKLLATELANLAKNVKKTIEETYKVETGFGYIHLLYKQFMDSLVHDLTIEQFADMYAQTIAYGLFSAKCMDDNDNFVWQEAIENIPNTNPFLKTLIKSCFEKNDRTNAFFDELEIKGIIDLLDKTDIKSILEAFNRRTGGGREDTVIYFYEDFLSEYEHETKKRRGVYYTPWPVVKFMVRAVDDILKSEFGFKDGLADTATKSVAIKRESKKKDRYGVKSLVDDTIDVPAIQILDPATGTGTFLREVILQIHDTFVENNKGKSDDEIKRLWNKYVPEQLLPRINGFELMMAPYAVAHMKLAMVLKETGYDFKSEERLKVILTNTLEPSKSDASFLDEGEQLNFFNDPLAAEAWQSDKVKNSPAINVIIGNPPYSGESANKGEWIMSLMEDYKKEPGGVEKLKERNPKWINDDYVKFLRYAQYCIEKSGQGIVGFINPHGFIDNPTFRGMRWKLLSVYDKIYIIDLHGNAKKKEICPDGSKDENVFDIQQGVSIVILLKNNATKNKPLATVYHKDLFGVRENKYNYLRNMLNCNVDYTNIVNSAPEFFMVPKDFSLKEKYEKGFNISSLFINNSVGVVTANDSVLIDINKKSLLDKVYTYYGIECDDSKIKKYLYRPFDFMNIYYDCNLIERAREKIMRNYLQRNIGLIYKRGFSEEKAVPINVVNSVSDFRSWSRPGMQGGDFSAPLYIYGDNLDRALNLKPEIVSEISGKLDLPFAPDSDGGGADSFAPIDLLDYIYAVLHSPKYRETYKEFLKIDFPRVPYLTDKDMFCKMVKLGGEIRKVHLMESSLLDTLITTYNGDGDNSVEKPKRDGEKVYINKTQYFDGVSDIAWNFYIGGYQPAQKWLKERKGKVLSEEDILHYQKIIVALTETDRLMKEVDTFFVF